MKRHSGFCEQSRKDSSVACTCGSVEQPAQAEPLTQAMKTAIAYGKRTHPEAGPVEGMSAERCICGSFRETNGYCKVCNKIYPAGAVDRAELRAAQIGTAIIKEYPFPGPDDHSVVDRFCDLRDALKDARIKLDRVAAELLMHINDEDFTMSLTNLYVYLTEDE